ncbi:hypothetical protein PIB30_098372 [Stylosanthes scabra]|uniref:CCHC-type domain-containing protein n=1 Tax=Stylosanthes scabra TaxID=79078 RepID=A0ABU6YUR8_9FABA|nr:hypothetical protein [Stylosanthes scabra]
MSEGERIEDALERLSKIFNSLSMLGRTYPEQDVRKNLVPKKQNKPPKCFECGEIGHIKPNCPKLQKGEKEKKLKKKQKAYISWENEDDSSTDSDDDEVAKICLMANEEKVSVGAKKSKWFVDSGCSKHMTGDEESLTNYRPIN